jgi:OOP family OmpA-OmpF porin
MRKKLLFFAFLFLIASLTVTKSKAQDSIYKSTTLVQPPLFSGYKGFRVWSFGLNAGMLAPFSATGGKNDFSKWVPTLGYGAYIKLQTSHLFGLQLDVYRGTLKANNDKLWAGAPPVSPFSSFSTEIDWAASVSGVFTLGNINWSRLHTTIQPYLSIGAGGVSFKPTTVSSTGVSERFNTAGSNTEFYVPFGLGIRANLSKSVNLDLGYTMAYVDADNLDGYLKAPYIGDKFSYAHIGLEFALGKSSKPQLARHNPPAQLAKNMKNEDDALRRSLAATEEKCRQQMIEMMAMKNDMNRMKMDSDNDGVSDYFDKCPGTTGGVKVDGAGCALPVPPPRDTAVKVINNTYVITEDDRMIVNEAVRNLEFDFAKATIRSKSYPYLNRLAEMLVKKGFSLKLGGHTDNIGSDDANMKLSKNRAESVKDYLINQNVNNGKIEAVGYGELQPIATNKTAEGRQKNRRVEFTLY